MEVPHRPPTELGAWLVVPEAGPGVLLPPSLALDALVGGFDAVAWTAVALIIVIVIVALISAGGQWK